MQPSLRQLLGYVKSTKVFRRNKKDVELKILAALLYFGLSLKTSDFLSFFEDESQASRAHFNGKRRLQNSELRDLQFYDGSVRDAVKSGFASVRGLIGEIFIEEDKELTETYEEILRALAVGNVFPKDVASFLGKTSSDIKSFLANLLEMGLVKRIKVFGKKRWIYRISSSVVDLFYYLDTKYGVSELNVDNRTFKSAYREKLPRYFEDFVRTALAEKFGGEEEIMLSPEVDAVITVRGKAVCCAEVKMKAGKKDLEVLRSKTSDLDCEKMIINADSVVSLFG